MERDSLEVFIDELRELYKSEQQFIMSMAEAAGTDHVNEFLGEFDTYPAQNKELTNERD